MKVEEEKGRFFPLRPSPGRNAFWIVSLTAACFAMARISNLLVFEPERISAVWPVSGLFLAALLLTRPKLRPWLVPPFVAAVMAADALAGTPFVTSLVFTVADAGEPILASWLLLRFAGSPFSFRRARDVFGFLAMVAVSHAVFPLFVADAVVSLEGGSFWAAAAFWAVSGGIGDLLITPLILCWASPPKGDPWTWNRKRAIEGTVLFVSLGLLNLVAFGRFAQHGQLSVVLSYLSFPFLLWAALRFGMRGVTSALVMVAAIAVGSIFVQLPESFPQGSRLEAVIAVQLYMAAMAVPSLFLAAVMNERREAEEMVRESRSLLRTLVDGTSERSSWATWTFPSRSFPRTTRW